MSTCKVKGDRRSVAVRRRGTSVDPAANGLGGEVSSGMMALTFDLTLTHLCAPPAVFLLTLCPNNCALLPLRLPLPGAVGRQQAVFGNHGNG